MRHRSIAIALTVGLAVWPAVVLTQSGVAVTTVADRDRVTVMQLAGIYDHQPPSNLAYEVEIRKAIAREYFRTHEDDVDFLVTISRFAYDLGSDVAGGSRVGGRYYGVKNDVSGIGMDLFDLSADFGSSGRLQGYIDIGPLSALVTNPSDPKFESSLGVLAHEVLHRWGAGVRFRDGDGSTSSALLGRDGRHWSFLLDSHNSVLYGNDWQDNGNGTFTSVGRSRAFYSPLDLYLMGFLDKTQVPPLTLIQNPSIDPARLPQLGATVNGMPKTITVDDIVAAEGERSPSASEAPKRFKIAYVFLVRPGEDATPLELNAVNTIREAFATRFLILTGGKGVVEAFPVSPAGELPPPDPVLPPSSGPRSGPVDLSQALAWVTSRQAGDGSFADSPWTRVRDTAAVIDLLKESPAAFAAQQKGLAWLTTAPDLHNVDGAARRIVALAPQFSSPDVAFLNDVRNSSGGWGLLRHFRSDALDTALALTALGQPSPADVAFLLSAQNADGGWPVQPNGQSSIVATLAVLSLESRAPPTELQNGLTRARAWLESRQNADGGFGDGGSSASASAAAVLYLAPTEFSRTALASALDYLRRTQLADGSWNESVYETALAVRALKAGELVNLKAGAISFTPSAPKDGDTVQIVATVVNSSLADVTDLVVRIHDGNPASGVTIGPDIVIPALGGLAETQVSATWDTTNQSGAHQIFVTVDPHGQVVESNEGDNIASQSIAVIAPPDRADLVITAADVLLAPSALRTIPQAQTLTARIANGGRTDAPQTTVSVFDGNPAAGGVKVAETMVDVPARSNAQAAFTFQVETPRDHRYFVVVDPLNQIPEASEQNNSTSVVLLMESTLDFAVAPDGVAFSENPVGLAKNLTISVPVANQGTTDAFAVKVRFVLNDASTPLELGTISLDLPAGQTRTASIVWHTIRAANGVPVVVAVDSNNAFTETSETNNTATSPLTVTAAQGINLHVSEKELFVTSPLHQGGTATVSIPVHNLGSTSASNVDVAFYMGVPGSGGVLIGTSQTIPSIPAGGRATASVQWNPVTALGNKVVFAEVDPAKAIQEYDEDDNTAFITVKALSLPDLVISSASISFVPAFPRQGDPITVAATVSNTGEQSANSVRVRFFNGNPTQGGVQIGADQIVSQVPGLFAAIAQVTLASPATAGMSQIHVLVDPSNEIAESNESNNTASRTLGVQDGSMWVSNVYLSPNGDEVQDTTDVFFRLDGVAAASVAVRDPHGTTVRTLPLAAAETSGSITWDGRGDDGTVVPDALYSLAVLDGDKRVVASAAATVDTNRAPMGAGFGPEFLIDNNLTCTAAGFVKADGYNVERFQTAGWLPDDSGLVQWFAIQDRCEYSNCSIQGPNYGHAFVSEPQVGVYITSADGQTRTRITPDSWTHDLGSLNGRGSLLKGVFLSPDGEKILILRQPYETPSVRIYLLDGYPGGQLAELWSINRDGSGLLQLGITSVAFTPRWSPDSQRVAFITPVISGKPQALVVVDADGRNSRIITSAGGTGQSALWDLTWSPDSARVVYSGLSHDGTQYVEHISASNANGTGTPTVVLRSPFLNFNDFSTLPLRGLSNVQWLADGRFVRLLPGTFGPDWVFMRDDLTSQLWEFSIAGADPRRLASNIEHVLDVRVSPDGRTIAYTDLAAHDAFMGSNRGPSTGVWIVDGHNPAEQLYAVETPWNDGAFYFELTRLDGLEWSPDGRRLFFTELPYANTFDNGYVYRDKQLRFIELNGRTLTRVDFPDQWDALNQRRLMVPQRLQPDGESYLYVAIEEDNFVYEFRRVKKTEFVSVSLRDRRESTLVVDDSISYDKSGHNPFFFDFNFRFSSSGNVLLYDSDRDSATETGTCWKGYVDASFPNGFSRKGAPDVFAVSSRVNLSAELGFQRQRSQVLIRGTAQDLNFAEYQLDYAQAGSGAWTTIGAASAVPVVNDVLAPWIPPADGRFDVRLTASDKAGNVATSTRRLTWGLRSTITNVSVAPRLFSPNGDGITDSLTVDYLVLGPVHLEFQIFNSDDVLVRTITQSHATMGPASIAWDGRNENGAFVAEGSYRIHVLDYDFFATVDVTPPSLTMSIGSALHILPQKQQCRTVATKQSCITHQGPLVDTPYTDMTGHVVDANLASWRLEAGEGNNPSEWQLLEQGTTARRGADVLDTLLRRFTKPQDVVGRRFRLHATDHAGNTTVVVSSFAPEELILFAWDATPAPTQHAIPHTPGLHQISMMHSIRAPIASLTLQYRLAGAAEWNAGLSVASAPLLFDLAWDNSLLAGGKLYDVRLIARDINDGVLVSNSVQILPDLFVMTAFDPKTQLTHGQRSLREPATITLVAVLDGDPNIGGFSAFSGEIDFTIPLLPDPMLTVCEARSLPARYKAVGLSGTVYYSNTLTVIRPGAKRDPSCEKPNAKLLLEVRTIEAPGCGAPNPNKVHIRLTGIGVEADSVRLSIQDAPFGLLKPLPGVTLPFELDLATDQRQEGRYSIIATGTAIGARPGSGAVSASASFVVDRQAPTAQITYPGSSQALCAVQVGTQAMVTLEGIADDPNFDRYVVEFGEGETPESWTTLFPRAIGEDASSRVPRRGPLATWNVTHLARGHYTVRLKVWDKGGNVSCTTVTFFFEGSVEVQNVTPLPRVFSPNDDGQFDVTTIAYALSMDARVDAKVHRIVNGQVAPTPIRTIVANAQELSGPNAVDWDGLADDGSPVPDGRYRIFVTAQDACGFKATSFADVEVDKTPPEAVISSPRTTDDPGVTVDIVGSVADPHLDRYVVDVGVGDAPTSWTRLASARTSVENALLAKWQNKGVAGDYTLQLTAYDTVGNARVTFVPITIPDRQLLVTDVAVEPTLISPNGDHKLDSTTIVYTTVQPARIVIDVLTRAGLVIATLADTTWQAPVQDQQVSWSGANEAGVLAADGEYTIRITATSLVDATRTQTEKTIVVVDTTKPAMLLTMPADQSFVRSPLEVLGTIEDLHMAAFTMRFRPALGGPEVTFASGDQNQVMASFGTLDLPAGSYAITLDAFDSAQNSVTRTIPFVVDNTAPAVTITQPVAGASLGGATPTVAVHGAVTEANLDHWTLRFGSGGEPDTWTIIATGTQPPSADLLASWETTAVADGDATLSLVATDKTGASSEARAPVHIDNTRPVASIALPASGSRVTAATAVTGTATDDRFKSATLDVSPGGEDAAFAFTQLTTIAHPVVAGELFKWQTLPPDGTYTLRLTVEDEGGLTASASTTVTLDTEPPAPLAGVVASVEDFRNARIEWNPSSETELAGYNVYRNGQKINNAIIAADVTTHLDIGIADGIHRYFVTVVDRAGLESKPSNEAQVHTDTTPPSVNILSPVNGGSVEGVVEVRGTAAAVDLKEYRVLVATAGAPGGFTLIKRSFVSTTSGVLAQWDTAGMADGAAVTIRLEADDLAGNTARDEVIVTIDNRAPAKPVLLSATQSPGIVTVKWQTGGESDLLGVLLYRNDVLANAGRFVANPRLYALNGTTYLDFPPADGEYRYYAVAIDQAGNLSEPSNAISVVIETHSPTAWIVRPFDGAKVEKPFALVGTTQDQDVAQFQFQYRRDASGPWTNIGGPVTANPPEAIWDPASAPGASYGAFELRVVATDKSGNIDPNPQAITVHYQDVTAPPVVDGLRALVTGDAVALTWNASGASDLAGYAVYREDADGFRVKVATTTPANATGFVDHPSPDGRYLYSVTASDSNDNESPPSLAVRARVYTPALDALPSCSTSLTTTVAGSSAEAGAVVSLIIDRGLGAAPVASTTADGDGRFRFANVALTRGANALWVHAVDGSGNTSKSSTPFTLVALPPPPAPTGFAATVSGRDVTLHWDAAADGVIGYRLQRDGVNLTPTVQDAPGTATASSDGGGSDPAANAIDSDPATAWVAELSAGSAAWWQLTLPAPMPLTAVGVAWLPGAIASEFDIEMWNGVAWVVVHRVSGNLWEQTYWSTPFTTTMLRLVVKSGVSGDPMLADVKLTRERLITGTSYVDTAGDGHHTYRLIPVSAAASCSVEGVAAEATVTVGDVVPPAPPANLVAEVNGPTVTLRWTPSPDPSAVAYHVYRNAGQDWLRTLWYTPGPIAADFPPNGRYVYRVTALDAAGNESTPSNEAVAIVEVASAVAAPVLVYPTDAAHPKTVRRVETTIAGTAEPGFLVTVVRDGFAEGSNIAQPGATTGNFTLASPPVGPTAFDPRRGVIASFTAGAAGNGLSLTDVYTLEREVLDGVVGTAGPSLSADGSKVAYVGVDEDDVSKLLVFDLASRAKTHTIEVPPGTISWVGYSPDGEFVALAVESPTPGMRQIWLVYLASGFVTPLTAEPAEIDQFVWSPDGASIAYVVDGTTLRLSHLYGGTTDIDSNAAHAPAFSTDGRLLAFVSSQSGAPDIWIHDFVLGTTTPLPADGPEVLERGLPAFSPDERSIAYLQKMDEAAAPALAVRDLVTGTVLQAATDAPWAQPRWTITRLLVLVNADNVTTVALPGYFQVDRVPLDPGLNLISAVATDSFGNDSAPAEPIALTRDAADLPDVVVEGFLVYPNLVTTGNPVRLSATVRNASAVAAGAFEVMFLATDDQGNAREIATPRRVSALPPGASLNLVLDWDTQSLNGRYRLDVIADLRGALTESTKTNNSASRDAIVSSTASPSVKVRTDRTTYAANQNVQLQVDVVNPGRSDRFTLDVFIEDAAGETAAELGHLVIPALGFGAHPVTFTWSTADTLAGSYRAHARLTDGSGNVVDSFSAFTIGGERAITAAVTTDRLTYSVAEAVQIRANVQNASANVESGELIAVTEVLNDAGIEVFRAESAIQNLQPRARAEVPTTWLTSAAGLFTVRFAVRSGDAELATGTARLAVHGTTKLTGLVRSAATALPVGQPAAIAAEVVNAGTLDVTGVLLRLVIQDPDTKQSMQTFERTIDLAIGARVTWDVTAATEALQVKTYAILLRAEFGGVVTTLATANVALVDVVAPTVQIISPAGAAFFNTPVTLTAVVSDTLSAVDRVEYQIDNGAWQQMPISDPTQSRYATVYPATTATEGLHTLSVRASDQTGNGPDSAPGDANPTSTTFTIDVTPPQITIDGVSGGLVSRDPVTPVITVADANLRDTSILLDGSPYVSGTPVSQSGSHTLSVIAADAAANMTSRTIQFTIDLNRAPSAGDQTLSLAEDTPASIHLDAGDPDGDALTFAVTPPSRGTLSGTAPDLVYTPEPDFYGADSFSFTVSDNAATSNRAVVTIQVTPVNDPPVAGAGADQTVNEGDAVALSGSARDVEGDSLTFAWTQVAGPNVSLQGADTLNPSFIAPDVPTGGATLTFRLVAADDQAQSEPSLVNVLVKNVNHAPVAHAGHDQRVGTGVGVTLDGSTSFDPDGDPVTYLWRQVGGLAVELTGDTTPVAAFTAPPVSGLLTFELTLSDGIATASDRVDVQVEVVNHPPVANAGADQAATEGARVQLDGAGSSDADGDALAYWWKQISGTPVRLENPAASVTSFVAPEVSTGGETLVFELEVTDVYGATATDRVNVLVLEPHTGPSCSTALATPSVLWPPNHKLVAIRIAGLGPDLRSNGDGLVVRIRRVTQDEPLNGTGDGDTSPDAFIGGDMVSLRAERSGGGNGRVYQIWFTAFDRAGASCEGSVFVAVPHDPKKPAVDDGQRYTATSRE